MDRWSSSGGADLPSFLDLINAVNNSISGIAIQARHRFLAAGPWCVVNGFIGQLSVQAVDCSIFLITLSLFYVATCSNTRSVHFKPSPLSTVLLIAAPWLLPLTTSLVALAKHYYQP